MSNTRETRKFINGLPLLIMQSINSRSYKPDSEIIFENREPLDPMIDGATIFEIKEDIETGSRSSLAAGTVHSSLDTLVNHGLIRREEVDLGQGDATLVYFLTCKGVDRFRWFILSANTIGRYKSPGKRGVRVGPGRGRPKLSENRRRKKRGGAADEG